jgi:maleylacetate reductase
MPAVPAFTPASPELNLQFIHEANPGRMIFGAGSRAKTGDELERLGITRAIVLSTPQQKDLAREIAESFGKRTAAFFADAAMHTPVEVTDEALKATGLTAADGVLSIGGGSTTGLGKAIALHTDLPHLVIPTTFAGSEMAPILGQTERGLKTTLRSMKVLPETVIYDPDLVMTMPPAIAGPSGMNAIAHSVEALYAKDVSPVSLLTAEESIRALGRSLPLVINDGTNNAAWAEALYGAWLAGVCLGTVGMALHHKICHTLGGTFNLDHAGIHCLMLPYSAAYNREAAPDAMQRVARALNTHDGPAGLYELMLQLGTHRSLREFGLTEADLDKAADLAIANPYWNPRPIERNAVRQMLQTAYEGSRP